MKLRSIKEIHDSDIYGVFVECGCAAALANALMTYEGSSKTVYYSNQPYSKIVQEQLYPAAGNYSRSVSFEFCDTALRAEMAKNLDIKFFLVTSWQMDIERNSIHGWYGIHDNGCTRFFHVTIRKTGDMVTRQSILSEIANIGIQFLLGRVDDTWEVALNSNSDETLIFVDDVRDGMGDPDLHTLLSIQSKCTHDYPLVFIDNKAVRFEELMRKSEKFAVQKGSFNPLHHAHTDIMTSAVENIPGKVWPVFLISTFRYDKPHIETDDTIARIASINTRDYPVIIMKSIYFYDTFDIFKKLTDKEFVFTLGTDTINRIYETDSEGLDTYSKKFLYISDQVRKYENQFKFLLFPRIGYELNSEIIPLYRKLIIDAQNYSGSDISSTKIRNGEAKNLLDE